MAHEHHHHGSKSEYITEQVLSLSFALAIALVCVFLWVPYPVSGQGTDTVVYGRKLSIILHPKFHVWVLVGAVALLVIIALRAIALWREISILKSEAKCNHDHHHGENCDHHHHHLENDKSGLENCHHHDHGQHHDHNHDGCGHDHSHEDCGHSHDMAPWRFMVLALPVILYFLNLPNEVFSNVKAVDLSQFGEVGAVAEKGVDFNVGFLQLEMAAMSQESRNHYEGKTVRLVGKYVGEDEKRFSLIRFKINCCAADAVPLNSVIMVDPASMEKINWKGYRNKWVQVTGRVHFLKRKDNDQFITALILYPDAEHKLNDDLIKVVPQDSNPYAN